MGSFRITWKNHSKYVNNQSHTDGTNYWKAHGAETKLNDGLYFAKPNKSILLDYVALLLYPSLEQSK